MNKNTVYNLTFFITVILTAVGTVMVYSASGMMSDYKYHNSMQFFLKQLVWITIGLVSFLFFRKLDYNKIREHTPEIIAATFVMLALVLVFAPSINGARRWLRFGPFSLQPAELAKISAVIFLAHYIAAAGKKMQDFKAGLVKPFAIIGTIVVLIFAERDFGIPTIIFITSLILLYSGGAKIKHLAIVFAAILPLAVFYIVKHSYRMNRLTIFLHPWSDPGKGGYQIIQSLTAFGSGGLFGRGLGGSKIKNMFLPEAHTDFIFPILGEEQGFVGTMIILLLFVALFYLGIHIAKNAKNLFGSMLAFGITLMLALQAIVNMGVSVALLPNKGLPLPFISFGGSSLLMALTCMGILLNICGQMEK